jgi:hypothetical protein
MVSASIEGMVFQRRVRSRSNAPGSPLAAHPARYNRNVIFVWRGWKLTSIGRRYLKRFFMHWMRVFGSGGGSAFAQPGWLE